MSTGMGTFIKARREEVRLTQTDLANAVHMSKSHLSEIERGKIGLPNADVRRRIAKALGVSHLDLLIAAGEITHDELQEVGKAGVVNIDTAVEEVIEDFRSFHWDETDINLVRGIIDVLRSAR